MSRTPTKRTCAKQIERWLAHGFTGCGFAQLFAKTHITFGVFDQIATAADLDALFEFAAAEHLPAIAVLLTIRSEQDLVAQLRVLQDGERWDVSRPTPKHLVTDELLIGLSWKVNERLVSMPMGFAPFGTMPVTRRAPYACIATWPGEHENEHPHRRKAKDSVVDFLDARLPEQMNKAKFDRIWDKSVARTGELLSELGDDAKYYRAVAFRLSAAAAGSFQDH